MSSPATLLITIPGCTATHVLGGTSVGLADGDLTLVSAPSVHSSADNSSEKKVLLTLTVDKAAFPLYKETVFGTVEGDERVYIFQPDLGEDIKGYVKIQLPEGVNIEGSEFRLLQERFEKILIDNGLLQAKVGGEQTSA